MLAVMKAVGPEKWVAIDGRPIAIASAIGKPQPSPRDGKTNASDLE